MSVSMPKSWPKKAKIHTAKRYEGEWIEWSKWSVYWVHERMSVENVRDLQVKCHKFLCAFPYNKKKQRKNYVVYRIHSYIFSLLFVEIFLSVWTWIKDNIFLKIKWTDVSVCVWRLWWKFILWANWGLMTVGGEWKGRGILFWGLKIIIHDEWGRFSHKNTFNFCIKLIPVNHV